MGEDQESGAAVVARAGGCGGDGAQARERGLALTGPDGLLKLFTKNVLETALNEEMTEHLGYEKNSCHSQGVLTDEDGGEAIELHYPVNG
jgi:transposase-like protein